MSHIDRRQFVIAKTAYPSDAFKHISLACGYILSYHPELRVTVCGDNILLGYAFSCEDGTPELDNPLAEMFKWAGRWVLITKNSVYLDACGSLGIFYGVDENGETVLSSSLHLINEFLHRKWIADHEIHRGDFHAIFDFYPIPYTPYEGIMALMPSQYWDFSAKQAVARTDFNFARYIDWDTNFILQTFTQAFINVLRNIEKTFPGEVWITLTGGVDSRSILAAAHKAGISYHVYTADRQDIEPWDYKTPLKICKKMKIPHTFMPDKAVVPTGSEREIEMLTHCGGRMTAGTEVGQFLRGADIETKTESVVLWGTTWPVTQHSYFKYFRPVDVNCTAEDFIAKVKEQYQPLCADALENSNVHRLSIEAWLRHVQAHPVPGFDWRDRQYWEQRAGAWGCSALQLLDMLDSVRIAPVNCQYLLELLSSATSATIDEQATSEFVINNSKVLQKQIIWECCPEIADIPYGEPTDLLYRLIRKIKRLLVRR